MPPDEFEFLLKYSILRGQIYGKLVIFLSSFPFLVQYSVNSHKIRCE